MTDSILMNTNLMENSELLLEKLKDMANHDNHAHKANHAKRTAIAMYGNSINRRPSAGCFNGVHNPEAMHPKEKCWALHPEQRTKRNLASRITSNNLSNCITSNNLSNRITTNHVKAAPEQTRPQNKRNPPLPTSHLPNSTGKGAADLHATKKGMASITLPENLARMAASEFILDAGIRFKLGRAPPSELLTDSNSVARAFGHQV
ncbi:hypothetical protein PCANC_00253 [Puccinia coronata f. sp. avenae]|uniref:Uncharacterized protein n=1 Tax=Puccinia coronata f. sp. avenae TaxID=200324 RepID=A0A2N5W9C8_9BASI|nr:hypothetical protein PCANC_00253 [Puccinia coronata f. sp. avenae]